MGEGGQDRRAQDIIRQQQNKKFFNGSAGKPPVWALALLGLLVIIGVGAVGAYALGIFPPGPTPVAESTTTPTTGDATNTPQVSPTAEVTSTVTLVTPTNTPVAIDVQYAAGLQAYEDRDWEAAEAAFRQVYLQNPAYPGLVQALGATYYNWGIVALNADQVETALERFNQALFFDSQHPLAQSRIDICNRFKEATKPQAEGTDPIAILAELLPGLLANPAEFESEGAFLRKVVDQLFKAYIETGDEAQEQGQQAEAERRMSDARVRYREAEKAYTKAQALPVKAEQREQAEGKLDEVSKLIAALPTPVPPAPPSRRFAASAPNPNYSTSGGRGSTSSCVQGRVIARGGAGVDAAVLEVNNNRGVTARTVSGNGGQYQICGMGADNWTVSLLYIPGSPPLFISPPPFAVFQVNGEANQRVGVNFSEQ